MASWPGSKRALRREAAGSVRHLGQTAQPVDEGQTAPSRRPRRASFSPARTAVETARPAASARFGEGTPEAASSLSPCRPIPEIQDATGPPPTSIHLGNELEGVVGLLVIPCLLALGQFHFVTGE